MAIDNPSYSRSLVIFATMNIINRLIRQAMSLSCYVIADPRDNSVTLSRRLFRHMRKASESGEAKVFVFRLPSDDTFGFMLEPGIEQPTQLCQVQYNGKYRCVGFETLCPSVGRIFYSYGLPADKTVKLSVSIRETAGGKTYYQLDRPPRKLIKRLRRHHSV